MRPALFLDLDGTLITTNSGRTFPLHSEDWKFIDAALECLLYHYNRGYLICIVTNQGGIQEGFVDERVFLRKIQSICVKLERIFKFPTNTILYQYCSKMDGYNRKPNPGMIYDLAVEHEIDVVNSVMIGDMLTDKQCAINAGIREYISISEVQAMEWHV